MLLRRRTTFRWGLRLGVAVAYFADPEHGARRRRGALEVLASVGRDTPLGPGLAWLRSLNEGDLEPPPRRDEVDAGGTTGSDREHVTGRGGSADRDREADAAHVPDADDGSDDGHHVNGDAVREDVGIRA